MFHSTLHQLICLQLNVKDDNQLTGTVPNELGNLGEVEILALGK